MIEIRFRKKGEVVSVSFPESTLPLSLRGEGDLLGVDLTGYAVIHMKCGRGGREKAEEMSRKAPSAFVIYEYEWRNGWGHGVLPPEHFDDRRVKRFRSTEQIRDAAVDADKKHKEILRERISKEIPGVRTWPATAPGMVEITPVQEVYGGFAVFAASLEEAHQKVVEKLPLWKEWNDRGLETFLRHSGRENPGEGNIRLRGNPQFDKKVEVKVLDKWVIFEMQDGAWVETGTRTAKFD